MRRTGARTLRRILAVLAVEREVGEASLASDAGVVHQQVDAGPQPVLDGGELVRDAHVGDEDLDLHAVRGLQLGGQFLEAVTPAGDDDEVRAVSGQGHGDGPPDPAGRTGDEGDGPASHGCRC